MLWFTCGKMNLTYCASWIYNLFSMPITKQCQWFMNEFPPWEAGDDGPFRLWALSPSPNPKPITPPPWGQFHHVWGTWHLTWPLQLLARTLRFQKYRAKDTCTYQQTEHAQVNSLIGSRKGKYKIPEKYAPEVVTCTYHLHKNRWLGIPHKNSYLIDTHFAFVTLLVFTLCIFAGKKLPECNGEKNEKKKSNQ